MSSFGLLALIVSIACVTGGIGLVVSRVLAPGSTSMTDIALGLVLFAVALCTFAVAQGWL
jgi:hypothetical protein